MPDTPRQISVQNAGPEIVATNYWQTGLPARGLVFVSVNARAFRVLVPPGFDLAELARTREVVVSRGPWPAEGIADAVELMFEDGTESPFALHVSPGQIDRLPPREDSGRHDLTCSVWIRGAGRPVKAASWPCGYRVVTQIPWMRGWESSDA